MAGTLAPSTPAKKSDAKEARPARVRARGQFLDSSSGGSSGGSNNNAAGVTAPSPSCQPPSRQVACPACTFLNDSRLPACEMCGTALPTNLQEHRERSSATAAMSAGSSAGSNRRGRGSSGTHDYNDGSSSNQHHRRGSERSDGSGGSGRGARDIRGRKKVPVFLQGKGKQKRGDSPPPPTEGQFSC